MMKRITIRTLAILALLLSLSLLLSGCSQREPEESSPAPETSLAESAEDTFEEATESSQESSPEGSSQEAESISAADLTEARLLTGTDDIWVLQGTKGFDPASLLKGDKNLIRGVVVDRSKLNFAQSSGMQRVTYQVVIDKAACEAYLNNLPDSYQADLVKVKELENVKEDDDSVIIVPVKQIVNMVTEAEVPNAKYTIYGDYGTIVTEETLKEKDQESSSSATESEDQKDSDASSDGSGNSSEASSGSSSSSSETASEASSESSSHASSETPSDASSHTSSETSSEVSHETSEESHEAVCEHDWVPLYETVHHDAVTHTEMVETTEYVYKVVCNTCGATFDHYSELDAHQDASWDDSLRDGKGAYACEGYHSDERYPVKVTEEQTVVDQEAYDEEVLIGYVCAKCGATK